MSQLRDEFELKKEVRTNGQQAGSGIAHHTVNHENHLVFFSDFFLRSFCFRPFGARSHQRRATEAHFQTHTNKKKTKTKLTTHSCFNFNIYIYDPIKIVTLDLHLWAYARAEQGSEQTNGARSPFMCKLLWFTCDCEYVVRCDACVCVATDPYAFSIFFKIYLKMCTRKWRCAHLRSGSISRVAQGNVNRAMWCRCVHVRDAYKCGCATNSTLTLKRTPDAQRQTERMRIDDAQLSTELCTKLINGRRRANAKSGIGRWKIFLLENNNNNCHLIGRYGWRI